MKKRYTEIFTVYSQPKVKDETSERISTSGDSGTRESGDKPDTRAEDLD